jgi:DNA-binding transcriptional regulator LsrR (DeoR family)
MCEVYVKLQIVGLVENNQIDWPITQEEIGDALGLSSVHVNRTLQELRGAGLITLDRKTLTVHDWDGLQAAGQFDASYLHLKPGRLISQPDGGAGGRGHSADLGTKAASALKNVPTRLAPAKVTSRG